MVEIKNVVKFLAVFFFSMFLFGTILLNCMNLSLEEIYGSIYDYAKPTVRGGFLDDMREVCDNLDLLLENPELSEDVYTQFDKEKLTRACMERGDERQFFIELMKLEAENLDDISGNDPRLDKFLKVMGNKKKNTITGIVVMVVCVIVLIAVEDTWGTFSKTMASTFLKVGLSLLFLFLIPKVLIYFIKPETSFLLNQDFTAKIGYEGVVIALIPIVLDVIITDRMFFWGGGLVIAATIIFLVLYIRRKLNKSESNYSEKTNYVHDRNNPAGSGSDGVRNGGNNRPEDNRNT